MRLHFELSPNTEIVPFDYQHFLIGAFHKWMRWNQIHDKLSLYSFGWLGGARRVSEGFSFPNGAKWFVSIWDDSQMKKLMQGALNDPEVCSGMHVRQIIIQEAIDTPHRNSFSLASPVFIRKYDENFRAQHLTWKDNDAGLYLTQTMKRKLKKAEIEKDVKIYFDDSYQNPKTKLVTIKGVGNRANYCPVIIEGDEEVINFAWNVGVGHSTGSGFGALI